MSKEDKTDRAIAERIVYMIGNIANRPDMREVQEKQIQMIVEALEAERAKVCVWPDETTISKKAIEICKSVISVTHEAGREKATREFYDWLRSTVKCKPLVLPERKHYKYDSHEEGYRPWDEAVVEGFNAAVDEVGKLNRGDV